MKRTLAIGDVHGCFAALQALVTVVGVRDEDVLVMLGDYVDRGPNTKDVIEWLIAFDSRHNLFPLRGNHEVMMLNARLHQSDRQRWGLVGGIETLESYAETDGDVADLGDIPDAHWEFLSHRLLPYFETDSHFFVHGSVDSSLPLAQQPDTQLYWGRYSARFTKHISGKVMVCGHKSQDSGLPATNGHGICIDTAAYKNGWLTCLDVESGHIWQANQAGVTRQFNLGELVADEAPAIPRQDQPGPDRD